MNPADPVQPVPDDAVTPDDTSLVVMPSSGSAVAPARPGIKIGPMVFVPEWGRRAGHDPWAHRKGEPRVFALLWAVYLMVASLSTIFGVRSLSVPTAQQYGFGAAAMMTLVAIGATLLWPATRLSQASPRKPGLSVLADLLVVLAPLHVMIWPMPVLTRWPWEIAAGMAVLLTSWTLLVAVPLWRAITRNDGLDRLVAMLMIVAMACAGPLALGAWALLGNPHEAPGWMWLLSPMTGVWELIRAPSGLTPRMSELERVMCAAPAVAALVWLIAGAIAGAPSRSRRTPGFGD